MKNLEPDLVAAFVPAPAMPRRARLRRVALRALAALVLVALAFHLAANVALNLYVRPKIEAAATHLSGATLRLGALRYEFWRDRLRCESLHLTLADRAPATTGPLSLTGIPWTSLLAAKKPAPAELLRHAQLEIRDLSAGLGAGEYQVRCGHLRVSVPTAEVTARDIALQTTVSDEAFFAADTFRRIRYRLALASLTARGLGFAEIFAGQAYRAESLELHAPQFESYVDREKPKRPPARIPPMPHEALAALAQPLSLGRLTVTDGSLRIMGRRFAGAEPGVLTFTALGLTARDIANPAAGGRTIELLAQGRLMDAGALTVKMSLPVAPAALAYSYSGELGPMDLTRLNAYLSGTGGFELKSGQTAGATFDVTVADGHARGVLNGVYEDLHVTVLDRETGSDQGLTSQVATVLANQLKVRHANTPDLPGPRKTGKIDYARTPEDTFLALSWNALRTGLTDLLTVM